MNSILLKVSLQHKIDTLIEGKKLTKTAFAKEIGISRDSVYNLDHTTRLGTILKICQYFKVNLSDIIDEDFTQNGKLNVINEEKAVYDVINYKV